MNGSDINKILNGLYSGGVGIAAGLIDKSDKNKPKDYFDKEYNYLKSTYQGAIDSANKILNPGQDNAVKPTDIDTTQDRINPTNGQPLPPISVTASGNENPTDQIPQTPTAPNINDLYARREKAIMDLSGMKYGAPYAESLNRLYKDHLDPQSDWEIKEGKDGQYVAINKKTFQVKSILEPTPKEKKFDDSNWKIFLDEKGQPYYGERVEKNGKIQIEFRDNLNQEELNDWNYNNDLKAKKLAPPTSGRGPGRRSSGPKKVEKLSFADKQLEDKVKKYADLKLKDRDSMLPEEQDKYNELNSEIKKLTGQNADDVTNKIMNSEDLQQGMEGIQDVKAQETDIMNNLNQIMDQYTSGEYDIADLEQQAYDWLGSLFSSGIDKSVLDKAYQVFNNFIHLQKGGTVEP